MLKILFFGSAGWIGQQFCKFINDEDQEGYVIIDAKSRADDETAVEKEIIEYKPDRIVSFTGRTSGPGFSTIDYLEQKGKLVENVRDNLYGPIVLAMMARKYNIHYTYLGTGCIFGGYPEEGYNENNRPDFFGSSYSTVKGFTDRLMHQYEDCVLNLRIRMPITADRHSKNFITKIMTYKKICNMPNSMTVLPTMFPVISDLIHKKITGTINLTNPGLISHNEILEMVKEIIDPNFTWENFSLEEQAKILLGARSNNYLDTEKLQKIYPDIPPIKEAVRNVLIEMKRNLTTN